ncbi:hypothetical protein [Sphingobium boeckii]|uniref:Uncharacterized protein n=1 Tax=Sphingobium boeckii TaxID=1082345 RepID=A0A7W9AK77_9SPHN|nr:hypothetical protein [Sphingobium boeckii]MBB5687209.1 hypothetical protein [Sphingobium boeckii]
MKKSAIITALIATTLSITHAHAKKEPKISGLELQQMQSKDIEGSKEIVFGAVMSVFQDAGYRIQAADKDTGLITGLGSTSGKVTYNLFMGFGKSKKTPIVSAYIEQIGPGITRVRINFVMGKLKSTIYGAGAQDEEPILDPIVYQEAFEKIDQAVFLRASMATTAPAPAAAAIAPLVDQTTVAAPPIQ